VCEGGIKHLMCSSCCSGRTGLERKRMMRWGEHRDDILRDMTTHP
jgi:hypothetical protein